MLVPNGSLVPSNVVERTAIAVLCAPENAREVKRSHSDTPCPQMRRENYLPVVSDEATILPYFIHIQTDDAPSSNMVIAVSAIPEVCKSTKGRNHVYLTGYYDFQPLGSSFTGRSCGLS